MYLRMMKYKRYIKRVPALLSEGYIIFQPHQYPEHTTWIHIIKKIYTVTTVLTVPNRLVWCAVIMQTKWLYMHTLIQSMYASVVGKHTLKQ